MTIEIFNRFHPAMFLSRKLQQLSFRLALFILLIIFSVLNHTSLKAQCNQPILVTFTDRNSHSITAKWNDINTDPLGWEIEIVKFGINPNGTANYPLITSKQFELQNLESGFSYQLYIRSQCDDDLYSKWNGPFKFELALDNPSPCQMSINLRDNNCNFPDRFYLQIDENGILGDDIFLKSIDLIIEHDWPADLNIQLIAPNGNSTLLSEFNGVVFDDFGDVNDTICVDYCTFSDEACESIKNGKPPFIGKWIPQEPLSQLAGSQVQGDWQLKICDNSINDVGILKYVNLNFEYNYCRKITNYFISDLVENSVKINWEQPQDCQQARILYGTSNLPINQWNTVLINCWLENYKITGLQENTCYSMVIQSDCGDINSVYSCQFDFCTTCSPVSEYEGFNTYPLCESNCEQSCILPKASHWHNINGDAQDWILWSGETPTEKTGPSQAYYGGGNYMYTESDPNLCGAGKKAYLVSDCMNVLPSDDCYMSFAYMMNGTDVGKLSLEISENAGSTWHTLFNKSGQQGNEWVETQVSLANYVGKTVILRFNSFDSKDNLGDIAIDEIKFYGSEFVPGTTYFRDVDGDGYGNSQDSINYCGTGIPSGYSSTPGDCNDNNPAINPGAAEIGCNLIDENCNGMLDETSTENPLTVTLDSSMNAHCNGSLDGMAALAIEGGFGEPITALWSDGGLGLVRTNLGIGNYGVTVTDGGNCQSVLHDITIGFDKMLDIEIVDITKPSCATSSNGSLSLNVMNGIEPFEVTWNNGDTTLIINNLNKGMYQVTITDSENCAAETEIIELTEESKLISGFSYKKNNSCFGDSLGVLEISVQNGTAPLVYQWSNGDTLKRITHLENGQYNVTVTDINGCQATNASKITSPDSLSAKIVNAENPKCFNSKDGVITAKIQGGALQYSYEWYKNGILYSGSNNGNNILNLDDGSYYLVVSDNNGCSAISDTVTLTKSEALTAQLDSIANSSCSKSDDGYLRIVLQGGKSPIYYSWNGTQSDTTFADGLLSGVYGFTAFDANNCKVTIPNIILSHGNESADIYTNILSENLCSDDRNASIEVEISQGATPIDFNWSAGEKSISESLVDTIEGLPGGNYRITVTDAEGCVSISPIVYISSPSPILYQIEEIMDNYCHGLMEGSIIIKSSGGTGNHQYQWNNNHATNENINLEAGTYYCTITDDNGCSVTTQALSIKDIKYDLVSIDIDQPTINESDGCIRLFPDNATLPIAIDWPEPLTDDVLEHCGLPQGNYTVMVTDNEGCIESYEIKLESTSSTTSVNFPHKVKIFPNPFSEEIHIVSDYEMDNLKVLDVTGKTVLALDTVPKIIQLKDLTDGIYLIRYSVAGHTYWLKIIKF